VAVEGGAATDVSLIHVPFMAGDASHPAAEGPGRYVQAGVERLLAGKGLMVDRQRVEAGSGVRPDVPSASRAVNQRLQAAVRSAIRAARLPIVLAGSCDAGIGVVAGLERGRCGVVWIDAHGDFNTPESSTSGFFPGMSLAIVTGHCYRELWASFGNRPPVPEDWVVLAGVRSLSPPEEARRLQDSAIRVVPWKQGRPQGDIASALDRLAGRVDEVYLHIDNDAFDPQTAPGIVDEPVPGGLSLAQMEEVVRAVTTRLRIAAATIATYTPASDQQDRTLMAGLRIIELLGEYAASVGRRPSGTARPGPAGTRVRPSDRP
jgi:arginase